jgi:hypothetical protein
MYNDSRHVFISLCSLVQNREQYMGGRYTLASSAYDALRNLIHTPPHTAKDCSDTGLDSTY